MSWLSCSCLVWLNLEEISWAILLDISCDLMTTVKKDKIMHFLKNTMRRTVKINVDESSKMEIGLVIFFMILRLMLLSSQGLWKCKDANKAKL